MSKIVGAKNISNWHKIIATSCSNSYKLPSSMTLLHIVLKNKKILVIVTITFFHRMPLIATGRSCCTKTWQSWDFKPANWRSFIDTSLFIFDEYPWETLIPCNNHKNFFSFLDRVWHVGDKYVLFPMSFGANSWSIPITSISSRNFLIFFVLPLMFRSVQIKLSHTC